MKNAQQKNKAVFRISLAVYLIALAGVVAYKFLFPVPVDNPYHLGAARTLTLMAGLSAIFYVFAFRFERSRHLVRGYFSAVDHPMNLAIFRIVLFAFLLCDFKAENFLFYSHFPKELMFPPFGTGWLVGILPVNEVWVGYAAILFKIFCWTALLGVGTRFSVVMTVIVFYYLGGIPQLFGKVNHYHNLLWFDAILAVSPSADYLSIDAILKAFRKADSGVVSPPPSSRAYGLPIRVIWLLMGVAYFGPGIWKLWNSGTAWILGDNLKLHMYYKWMDFDGWMPVFRLDQHPLLYHEGGAFTIAFEVGFIFLILFPRLRWLAVVSGLVFHTLTGIFMRIGFANLRNFYFIFFPWDRILNRLGEWLFPKDMTVFFDGNCELCRRTVASVRVFDIFQRVRYLNALSLEPQRELKEAGIDLQATLRDIHAVSGRKIYKGYEAYRALAFRIPILWPLLPFLFFWPVTVIGKIIYRKIADSRSCKIPIKSVANPPEILPSKACVIVGTILVIGNLYCGLWDIGSGWPFAGYPTFSNIASKYFSTLELQVTTRDGRTVFLNNETFTDKSSPERFTGLVSNILKDSAQRDKRLKNLWSLIVQAQPSLSLVQSVKFFEVIKTTIPEEKFRNPLNRKLIYELQLDSKE